MSADHEREEDFRVHVPQPVAPPATVSREGQRPLHSFKDAASSRTVNYEAAASSSSRSSVFAFFGEDVGTGSTDLGSDDFDVEPADDTLVGRLGSAGKPRAKWQHPEAVPRPVNLGVYGNKQEANHPPARHTSPVRFSNDTKGGGGGQRALSPGALWAGAPEPRPPSMQYVAGLDFDPLDFGSEVSPLRSQPSSQLLDLSRLAFTTGAVTVASSSPGSITDNARSRSYYGSSGGKTVDVEGAACMAVNSRTEESKRSSLNVSTDACPHHRPRKGSRSQETSPTQSFRHMSPSLAAAVQAASPWITGASLLYLLLLLLLSLLFLLFLLFVQTSLLAARVSL